VGTIVSGVGVVDKAVVLVSALEPEPLSLAELTARTGLSRATVHRLAVALEAHGLVRRDPYGRFALGLRLVGLGAAAAAQSPWWEVAWPVLVRLRDDTGESVQLFVRDGDRRVCVQSLESPHGLRWIVPVGAVLPLDKGSAGRVLSAHAADLLPATHPPTPTNPTSNPYATESVPNRRRRWVESVEEREAGVASVSAPVVHDGMILAAVSVSGPLERLSTSPGRRYGRRVVQAAEALERAAGLRP
jgi:DNA-binding IclR family transcriptional regulator